MKKVNDTIIFDTPEDQRIGLLKYNEPPFGLKFLFIFPDDQIRRFHTLGMKFSIDIYFFNSNKELVKVYKNCRPGMPRISSDVPAKYVLEIPSKIIDLQEIYKRKKI